MKKLILLMAIWLVAAGCVSAGKYQMKTDEANKYQSLSDRLSNEKAGLEQEKAALEKRLADMDANNKNLTDALTATKSKKDKMISDLTQDKQDLQDKIAKLEAQLADLAKQNEASIAELKKNYDNLVQGMKSEIENGEIQITQLQGKLTVNMVDRVLFNSGEAEVNQQGRATLEKVGAILKTISGKQIRIEGHTDNVPISKELQQKYPSNWELSTARATHVARYLIEKVGFDSKLISVSGYADTRPVDTNTTPEGRAKNRRIEIVLIPADALPAPASVTITK